MLAALGGASTACQQAARSLRQLRHAIPSAIDRVAWIGVGVRTVDDLEAWRSTGIKSPRVAARWLAAGVVDPGEASEWRKLGFESPESVRRWRSNGFGPEQASHWRTAGPRRSRLLWVKDGLTHTDAEGWAALGVELPVFMYPWLRVGVLSGSEASTWARAGVRAPLDVVRWWAVGALDASDAAAWCEAGVGPDGLDPWLDAGVACGREMVVWRRLGVVEPEDLSGWRSAGVRDGITARRWLNAGVRSLEEVLAWAEVGVEDPSEARPLGVSDDPRDLAVASWDGMVYSPWAKNRAPARIVTTPPWCAAPSAVTTEHYHYAFGRPSTLEAATDVIEIDFDTTGWEVSRRYRPVPNGRRASMVGKRW